MTSSPTPEPGRIRAAAHGFAGEGAARAYEQARPSYPAEAVAHVVGHGGIGPGRRVLDLAAGTGKLTRLLVPTGAEVVAVEPVEEMRARIGAGARVLAGTAEAIPLDDASADAVTVAQAFHWFDGPLALAEIHRVLRPGSALALVWNRRPLDDPLHARIEALIRPHRGSAPSYASGAWRRALDGSALFGPLEERTFAHERAVDADALADRVGSMSFVAALDAGPRAEIVRAARELAAGGPVALRYVCELFVCDRRP